jgi:deazaflavin-dependent oxidoreductase (nitroreductase family)
MAINKLPGGTRGARTPPRMMSKVLMPVMMRIHRRSKDTFRGMDLLYLTTVGARSGEKRTNPVARFDDGQGGWIIIASANGAARHPGWYHNLAANPGQVWAEVGNRKYPVQVDQLDGDDRDKAWVTVIERAPSFNAYLNKTDRQLPVLRLTPVAHSAQS